MSGKVRKSREICREMSGIVGNCREMSGIVGKCRESSGNVGKCREIRIMKIIDFSILADLAILRPFSEGSPVGKGLEMP